MATLTQDRKTEIAKDLRIASTWVQGERRVKLLSIAEEIDGTEPEKIEEAVIERVQRFSRPTAASSPDLPKGDDED